jgi:hypothetical protein
MEDDRIADAPPDDILAREFQNALDVRLATTSGLV